jgi:beta-lactamase regulating signal transducer with metallopeptidase domain
MHPLPWLDRLNAIAPALTDAALRGAVILLIALAISHAMRRRSAAARHLAWVGAIAVQLALPVFAIWGPRWQVAVPSAIAGVLPVTLPEARVDEPAPSSRASNGSASVRSPEIPTYVIDVSSPAAKTSEPSAPPVTSSTTPAAAGPSTPSISGRAILLFIWLFGALIVLARLAIGTTIVATLARRGARVEDGAWLSMAQRLSSSLDIARPLTLLRGDKVGVPITWGIVYPVVLLPDDADAWPEERRRFVLVHEMAHVKRLDALTQLAGQLALALFWFDPLVWIANRRMQLEREHACDDYVLRHGTSPSHYAEELLAMVRSLGTSDHRTAQPAFAALAMARRSEFEGRMLSILDPVLDRHPLSKGRTLMSAIAAFFLVVPLAAMHPYRRAETTVSAAPAAVTRHMADTMLPESFKISIHSTDEPAAARPAEPAPPRSALASPTSPTIPSSPSLAGAAGTLKGASGALGAPATNVATKPKQVTQSVTSCDAISFNGSTRTSTHLHSDDSGDGNGVFQYLGVTTDRCSQAVITGRVTFNDAEDDIASMSPSAHAVFRERTPRDDREVVVRRSDDGSITHIYRFDGAAAPYDDGARRWLAGFLPQVLREGAVNVGPRVARWRAEGGVEHVLSMIGTIHSSGAKRAHYDVLLDDRLSSDDLDRVVRQAGRDLKGSSGDLRAILEKAAPGVRNGKGARSPSALEAAVMAIPSSGDRTAVLQAYGQSTDREMLLSVMRMAETIPSSGDKAMLLSVLAPQYLAGKDDALREAFFRTLSTVPSSGDIRSVLSGAVMGYAASSNEVALAVAQATSDVASSGDRAAVLVQLADIGALRTSAVRDAYMRAAQNLASGDMSTVLQAAARH